MMDGSGEIAKRAGLNEAGGGLAMSRVSLIRLWRYW
jgi:hypothetical protein